MKLLIWIIKQMKSEETFDYFRGQFPKSKAQELKRIMQRPSVNHSQSAGNGINQYSSTDWYSWTKKSDQSYFEMRIDNNKYGGRSRITVWRWDNKEESHKPKETKKVYKNVGKYRNGGKPKLMTA